MLRARQQAQLIRMALAVVAVTALATLLLWVLPSSLDIALSAIVVVPALLVWLWQRPVRGLYVLLAMAVVQEEYFFTSYSDDLGRFVPFFEDLATWTHIKGLSFSMAEIFMLLVLVIWLLKDIAGRRLCFDKGSLMRPLGLYMLMVLVSEVHGVTSGGDVTTSLWEVRSQVYMFVAYILACNLIKTRKQVDVVVWILLLGGGIKGVQGTWRWLITLHGNLHGVEEIFPHEQSFFFNAFLTLTLILLLYGSSRRLKRTALGLLPFVILATLANQRRAAIVALLVALLGLVFVTLVAYRPRRRAMVKLLLVMAVLLPPYVIIFGHSNSQVASPARAIMSAFHPDPRDAGSNWYRNNEDGDIMYTMKQSPLIGYGFGKPMIRAYTLPDISNIYVWWLVLPHNSILWVWMRLGTIGYVLLWLLIGMAIVQAAQLVRRFEDPTLKGLALWLILLVMQEIVFGYLDLQWTNYRNLITFGVLFALVGRLATFARTEESAPGRAHAAPGLHRGTMATPSLSHSLAIVNGRLTRQPTRSGGAAGRLRVGKHHD